MRGGGGGGGGGGTRSHTLMQMTIRLLKCCDSKAITLISIHLPGVHNIQADSLSRVGQTLTTEWTMAMESLRPLFATDRFVCDIRQQTTRQARIAVSGPQGVVVRCHVHALGLQEGPSCTHSCHSRWSRMYCRRSLSHQEWRWFWLLNCKRQHHGSQSWWTYPKKIWFHCSSKVKTYWHKTENVTSDRVETLQAILRAKGHSREAANMMSRCHRESSQQVYESHWSRFVAFCRTKKMASVSSQKSSFQHLRDAPLQGRTTSIDFNFTSHVCGFCATSLGVQSISRPIHQAIGQGFPAGMSGATQNHA